jgi:hypothetical protein
MLLLVQTGAEKQPHVIAAARVARAPRHDPDEEVARGK